MANPIFSRRGPPTYYLAIFFVEKKFKNCMQWKDLDQGASLVPPRIPPPISDDRLSWECMCFFQQWRFQDLQKGDVNTPPPPPRWGVDRRPTYFFANFPQTAWTLKKVGPRRGVCPWHPFRSNNGKPWWIHIPRGSKFFEVHANFGEI